MKKSIIFITILSAGLFLAASCSKNTPPVFDDSLAFVAFDSPSITTGEATVKPNGDIIARTDVFKVPVTLASAKGISETVKFSIKETPFLFKDYVDPEGDLEDETNWVDRTAHSGVNFNLLTKSGTLTFDAEHRTQYIEFEILYVDTYTKDLRFQIELSKPESINLGYNTVCTITLSDVNHPLTAMLGDYTMTGESYWYGVESWPMEIRKDDKDDHMVWFLDIANVAPREDMMFYGNVDEDMTTITVPFGQATEYIYSYGEPLFLYGITSDFYDVSEGNLVIEIRKNDEGAVTGLKFPEEYGLWVMSFKEPAHENNLNFAIYLAGTLSAVKN